MAEVAKKFANLTSLLSLLSVTTVYAALRYHVFADIPWSRFLLFVLNKALAWSALVLLALASIKRVISTDTPTAATLFFQGIGLTMAHTLLSLLLLHPEEYPLFFNPENRFTVPIQLSFLVAIVGCTILLRSLGQRSLSLLFSFCMLLHTSLIGYSNWLHPEKWPGFMPPITLLCSILSLIWTISLVYTISRSFATQSTAPIP